MAISYERVAASRISDYTNITSVTLTASGTTANNLLICAITVPGFPTDLTGPTGWTLIGTKSHVGFFVAAYYRIATGDSNDNATISWAVADFCTAGIFEYTGNVTIGVLDSNKTADVSNSGTSLAASTVTPNSQPGALISFFGAGVANYWNSVGPTFDLSTKDADLFGVDWTPSVSIAHVGYTSTDGIDSTWSTTGAGGGKFGVIQAGFKAAAAEAGVDLSGNAANESTATGTASFTIPMVGASVSLTTANATITTAIPFAGDVASVTDADGNLSLSVGLHGSMLSDAVASVLLSSSSPLSGSAGSQAGLAAALSVGSGLAGSADSEAEAAASISSSSPMAGSAEAEADAAAALSVGSGLAGSADSEAEAAASISSSSPLAGSAESEADAAADLSVGSGLAGSVLADAMANGALSLSFSLDGAALSEAMAAAVLSVGSSVSLSGDMAAESSAGSSSLQMDVPVFGASASAADAGGVLTTIVPLEGAGASVTAMLGSLDVGIGFAGSANADAMANGMMTFRVNLSADAVAQAAASGLLSAAGDLVSDARYLSPFHSRDYVSQHKPRAWVSSWN